ncbi:MAG: phospho-sugar mutase [Flavobacteriales bacterium]|jgi:phosphoglucomutase
MEISAEIQAKVNAWLTPEVDDATQQAIKDMMVNDPKNLIESFYTDLDFGTGGLRGVMGPGTNRINRYTIGMATQGLANYIKSQFPVSQSSVAIAYDSRNNSEFFARTAADVLSANDIRVKLFKELRPTPLLSFAVRELKCQAGIVITASHNPPEYNGYKVYWDDGAQVLPPHDTGIIKEVRAVNGIGAVNFKAKEYLIDYIDDKVEQAYFKKLNEIILSKEEIKKASNLKVVYTSIHGTGITMVPKALKELGFANVLIVEEQAVPDGNFPTVHSPNPEERDALNLALQLAEKENADMLFGTDPDADRVGIAVRNDKHELILLNGNQTGSILVYYQISQRKNRNLLKGNEYVAKTIVTTDLIEDIAKSFNIPWYDTLTGFKYIAGVMREKEGKEYFIGGGEESYGYLVGEFVRDKDAVLSSVVIAEMAAWASANNTSLYGMLMDIYAQYGLYHEELVSITIKGMDGVEKIKSMMAELRAKPPVSLGGSEVIEVRDISTATRKNIKTGAETKMDLPTSNVLQFVLADGSKISARPSGTEPKIKFYFSIKEAFEGRQHYNKQVDRIKKRMETIRGELGV